MHTPARLPRQPDLLALFNAARPKLHSLLLGCRVPLEDADDVLHDCWVALLAQPHGMREVGNPEAWLVGTMRNTILQYWRRRRRQDRFLARWSHAAPASEPAPQESEDAARDVATLTAHLSVRDVQVLWLRFGLGQKPREIAKILGCQPDYVRKITRRALERVRRQLAAAGYPRGLRCGAPAAGAVHPVVLAPAPTRPSPSGANRNAFPRPIQATTDRSREPHRDETSRQLLCCLTPLPKARRR
jgi:RNA polymerase sigma-70 factor (ECF subfamily)